jgi:anaerobic magnesium-protoporphyrin IX monomethyl ester cyclase
VQAIQADDWDVIATGGTTAYGYMKKTVQLARQYAPNALIMIGGGALTAMPRDIMGFCPEIDLGGIGEGVVTFPEVLKKVDEGRTRTGDWSDVAGIIWRTAAAEVRLNPERPLMAEIDTLPFPAYELFPLDIYFKNSCILLSEEAMQAKRRLDINMSYGCSLICRFCFHLGLTRDMKYTNTQQVDGGDVVFNNDRNIRWHSAEYVLKQVKCMKERFNVDFVSFLDENLMTMHVSTHKKWLFEIRDLWIKAGLQPSCVRDRRSIMVSAHIHESKVIVPRILGSSGDPSYDDACLATVSGADGSRLAPVLARLTRAEKSVRIREVATC